MVEEEDGLGTFARKIAKCRVYNVAIIDEQPGATVGQRVSDRRGACGRIIVELGTGAVEVAGMKELGQPVVDAVERAADEGGNFAAFRRRNRLRWKIRRRGSDSSRRLSKREAMAAARRAVRICATQGLSMHTWNARRGF